MPVFRVEKNSNYTTMCNYHLRDQGLSLKGKGLLSMLLSLPDTWNYSVRGLSSITPDGVDGVLTALKELERLGYLERNQQREDKSMAFLTTTASALSLFSQLFMLLSRMAKLFGVFA